MRHAYQVEIVPLEHKGVHAYIVGLDPNTQSLAIGTTYTNRTGGDVRTINHCASIVGHPGKQGLERNVDELVEKSEGDFTSRTDVIKYAVRLLYREKKHFKPTG